MILETSVGRCKPFDTPAARATQGEQSLTQWVTTPFVLSSAVFCAYRSMSGVATNVFRMIQLLIHLSALSISHRVEVARV